MITLKHVLQLKSSRILQISFLIAFFISSAVGLNAQIKKPEVAVPEVTIAGSQLLHISSSITKKDYDLYINLPGGYKDTTKTFPVLFLIDAQWDFPLVQAIYGEQYYDGFVPEMVIVGITWGGEHPDYDKLRAHDFTPTDISNNGTFGNAPNFLSFISKELIPYIEKNFRVKQDDRTLVGSSYGGLFSLYALFQNPAVFDRFIFTSPALQWDNNLMSRVNTEYAGQHARLKAKVFSAIGEYENVAEYEKFMDEIKAKSYNQLDLQTMVVKGMGHSGAKAEGYARGLQAVFKPEPVQVNADILNTYAGAYTTIGYALSLVVEDGKLVAKTPDNGSFVLDATSNTDFYVAGQFLKLHFIKDQSGKVSGFNLQQYGGDTFFSKTNK